MWTEISEKLKYYTIALMTFTSKELKDKGKQDSEFEWNLNPKNINIIPELELFDDERNIRETINSTEFSDMLQKLLRTVHELTLEKLKNNKPN